METLLRGLLIDLEHRCLALCQRLSAVTDVDLRAQALLCYRRIEQTRRKAVSLLADPALSEAALLVNHWQQCNQWSQEVMRYEEMLLPFIERYTDADRRMTALCRRLLQEIRWPLSAPLIATFSNQYYWTVAPLNAVCMPAAEDTTMLGWPDLLHELGHILTEHHEAELVGDFKQHLAQYIQDEQRRVRTQQRSGDLHQQYAVLHAAWLDSWLYEFVADMVATYLGGSTFGWQNIRLCARVSESLYVPHLGEMATHPADQARMEGIVAVLHEMGDTDAATQLELTWQQYAQIHAEPRPADFDLSYPAQLLNALARHVVAGCIALGILDYRASQAQSATIIGTIIQGWERFLADPQAHRTWEQTRLQAIWQEIQGTI